MHSHPHAFKNKPKGEFSVQQIETHWPLGPEEFKKAYPDGRMGSNPSKATPEHGEKIYRIAVDAICQELG